MKKLNLIFLLSIFFSFFTTSLYADINFISPIKGNWANKQMLVIEQDLDGEYLYSLDGSDPETFGFAYDGPVLLDVNGKVKLRVTHIFSDGRKESGSVDFSVNQDPGFSRQYTDFIQSFYDTGIINYSSGTVLSIPQNLMYSLGLPPDSFLKGTDISLSEKCVLTRHIPCTILDPADNKQWRFIIKTFPQAAGTYSRHDLPFTITDWETINFTDNNLLFKFDGEYWYLPKESRIIDRTKSHMILWQNLNYKSDNPIEFFVLPPKPVINVEKKDDGSFTYSLEGDNSYKMSILSKNVNEYQELYSEICADTFPGDKISGQFNIGIYSSSLYQGEFPVEYNINKRPISSPIIHSDSKSFYSRDKVHVIIEGDASSDLYVAVSNPYIIEDMDNIPDEHSAILKNIDVNEYVYNKNKCELEFEPVDGVPVYYKVRAYNRKNKVKSFVTEYSVIIDQYNYYFVEDEKVTDGDGSLDNPFNSFEKCMEQIQKSDSVCLRIKGKAEIPDRTYSLPKKVIIKNYEDGLLYFNSNSSFELNNCDLNISGCRMEKVAGSDNGMNSMFVLKDSVASFDKCQISANFSKNATVFDLNTSVLNLSNCMASVTASAYTSFISSNASKVIIEDSQINTIGDTAVVISASKGTVSVEKSTLKVTGKTGRIAELYNLNARLINNTLAGELNKAGKKFVPVFANKSVNLTEINNEITGF